MGKQLQQLGTTFDRARTNSSAPLMPLDITDGIESRKTHVYDVTGAILAVHDELGPGVNEYCYQEGLEVELTLRNIPFEREVTFHPLYKGPPLHVEYRVDFLCKGDIVVECKAVAALNATFRAQLFNYMRLLKVPYGIIVNFSPKFAELERYFYDTASKTILTVAGVPVK